MNEKLIVDENNYLPRQQQIIEEQTYMEHQQVNERKGSNEINVIHYNKHDAETKTIITTEEGVGGYGIKETHYQKF